MFCRSCTFALFENSVRLLLNIKMIKINFRRFNFRAGGGRRFSDMQPHRCGRVYTTHTQREKDIPQNMQKELKLNKPNNRIDVEDGVKLNRRMDGGK